MILWIIIAAGVLLLLASLKFKAVYAAIGAIIIGIGVIVHGEWYGWFAIGAGVAGLLFLLISLKWLTRGGAIIVSALVLIATVAWPAEGNTKEPEEVAGNTTTTTESTTTTTIPEEDLGLTEEESQQVAADLAEIYQGFLPGEVATGTGNIPDSPEERAANVSFTKETIETREDLCTFFASNHEKAPQARARVEQALREAGYGDDEVHEALDAECSRWIWVAPTVESQILGTTFVLSNNEVVQSENYRGVAPNDAMWHYITTDGHIVAGAAVRADCGNPNVKIVRPVRPDTPEVPPIDVPPGTPCPWKPELPVDSPDCLKPKDPSVDINHPDSQAPDQVKGPGTTPVGTSPGPATPPVDSSTGCNGPCPGSGTTTTQPSGGSGGTTTTVPSCGQAGQPSCDNTGVTSPSTSAPPPAPPDTSSPDVTVVSP